MYGYGNDNDEVLSTYASIWEQPGRLAEVTDKIEPLEVGTSCKSMQELLRSQSFEKFLGIFNEIAARDCQARNQYGYQSATANDLLKDKYTRDRAYLLWQKLRLTGRVTTTQEIDEKLRQWMTQLDEVGVKEGEVQLMRAKIGA